MTIENLSPDSLSNQYLGDGVQTAFPVTFPIFGEGRNVRAIISTGSGSSLERRDLVYGIDYTVIEVTGGGECRTTEPVPAGHALTLCLDIPHRQPREFFNQGRLDAKELEKGLDYVTTLTAQNAATLSRTVMVPAGDPRSPQGVIDDIFTARDEAQEARGEAQSAQADAETAQGAAQSAQSAAETARTAAEEAHAAAALHADRAEEARDTAQGYAAQAAMVNIPPASDLIRGGIRVGEGLALTEEDKLNVSVPPPFPSPSAEDKDKVLTVGEDGVLAWQKVATPEGGSGSGSAFPVPTGEAGIGQVLQVSGRTVPPGGTWLVWAFCSTAISSVNGVFFPGGYSGSAALIGVYPGGATVPLSSTSATMAGMLCWRIA